MGGRGDDMMSTLGSRVVGAENMHRIPEFMDATDADDGNHSTSRAAVVDDRIPGNKSRLQRGRKAFRFHEQGIFVKQNEALRAKEIRMMRAGFASGRKRTSFFEESDISFRHEEETSVSILPASLLSGNDEIVSSRSSCSSLTTLAIILEDIQSLGLPLPPPADMLIPTHPVQKATVAAAVAAKTPTEMVNLASEGRNGNEEKNVDFFSALPDELISLPYAPLRIERWDVGFLPVENRQSSEACYYFGGLTEVSLSDDKSRGRSESSNDAAFGENIKTENSDMTLSVAYKNSKYHALVLRPAIVKPCGYEHSSLANPPPLPVYLTLKERKRIRRQNREEQRREIQDKITLGLLEAPEPKLKLANFMKVCVLCYVLDVDYLSEFFFAHTFLSDLLGL